MAVTSNKAARPGGSPRFVPIAIGMAVVLILAAGGLLGYALRAGPSGISGGVLSNAIGGPFHLIDQNGRPFTDADLKGKWHLVFFGYTHCPDICPTTLNDLSLAYDKLAKRQKGDLSVVFISVDPERDTPAVMKSYAASFDAPIVGLTGTPAEVKQAAADYRVYYAKHYRADGGYDMDHSAVVYVLDPNGRFVATITPDEAVKEIEAKLEKLVS
jgi:protein SCO1